MRQKVSVWNRENVAKGRTVTTPVSAEKGKRRDNILPRGLLIDLRGKSALQQSCFALEDPSNGAARWILPNDSKSL